MYGKLHAIMNVSHDLIMFNHVHYGAKMSQLLTVSPNNDTRKIMVDIRFIWQIRNRDNVA